MDALVDRLGVLLLFREDVGFGRRVVDAVLYFVGGFCLQLVCIMKRHDGNLLCLRFEV